MLNTYFSPSIKVEVTQKIPLGELIVNSDEEYSYPFELKYTYKL